MAKNQSLNAAAKAKEDEFYTQLTDIERELRHYRPHFKDKVVFCNCDDPFESNFFKCFVLQFNRLGLKKLIATCYTGSPIAGSQLSLFDVVPDAQANRPYKAVVTSVRDATGDGGVGMEDVPDHYEPRETRYWVDEGGQKWRSMGNITWYTNLDIKKRHEEMILFRRYDPDKYPRYANYDAIEVSKVSEIPCDHPGFMGAPVTFLDKYNPDQFEIIGQSRTLGRPMSEIAEKGEYVSGGVRFYLRNEEAASREYKYRCLYDRIVVRNKHPELPKAL